MVIMSVCMFIGAHFNPSCPPWASSLSRNSGTPKVPSPKDTQGPFQGGLCSSADELRLEQLGERERDRYQSRQRERNRNLLRLRTLASASASWFTCFYKYIYKYFRNKRFTIIQSLYDFLKVYL